MSKAPLNDSQLAAIHTPPSKPDLRIPRMNRWPYDARLHEKGGFSKSPATAESESRGRNGRRDKTKAKKQRESHKKGRTGKGIAIRARLLPESEYVAPSG